MRLIARLGIAALLCGAAAMTFGGAAAQEKGKVKVGDKAPAFQATDENGRTWKSSEHVGKKVIVLYFYPADFTGGCTAQACGFRDKIGNLKSKDVEVVGVSGDSAENHKKFKEDFKLPFTLLADEKGEVAKAFGIPANKGGTAKGKTSSGDIISVTQGVRISRYTVVIDKNGNVAAIDQISNAGGDAERVAALVNKLESK